MSSATNPFVELSIASTTAHPDELHRLVARAVRGLGGRRPLLLLADLHQRELVPFGRTTTRVWSIDGTLAGRAYQSQQVVIGPRPRGDGGGLRRIWVPVMDASERVGVLGVLVDRTDPETLATFEGLASLAGELVMSKRRYGDGIELTRRRAEMDLAAEMRWALLPPLTFSSAVIDVSGALEPAYEIAGDAFDYAVNADEAHVAILDAMGHGLEASRMANVAVGAYRNARRRGFGLRESFAMIDQTIAEAFGAERFVTGQMGVLDLGDGRLRCLNAGHPRPMLLRGTSQLGDLPADPSPPFGLGLVTSEIAEISLEPDDLVLFFSDGITEARSADGTEFGRERLGDMLCRSASSGLPIAEIIRRVVHAVVEHQQGKVRDDATLLALRWRGKRRRTGG